MGDSNVQENGFGCKDIPNIEMKQMFFFACCEIEVSDWAICQKQLFHQVRAGFNSPYWSVGCSIGQPFVEETTILAKTLCHP